MSCQFYFAISYLLQRIMAASRQQHANPVVQALLGAIAQQALPPQVEVDPAAVPEVALPPVEPIDLSLPSTPTPPPPVLQPDAPATPRHQLLRRLLRALPIASDDQMNAMLSVFDPAHELPAARAPPKSINSVPGPNCQTSHHLPRRDVARRSELGRPITTSPDAAVTQKVGLRPPRPPLPNNFAPFSPQTPVWSRSTSISAYVGPLTRTFSQSGMLTQPQIGHSQAPPAWGAQTQAPVASQPFA